MRKMENKIFDIVAIIVGISGSGKTNVIKTLEDIERLKTILQNSRKK